MLGRRHIFAAALLALAGCPGDPTGGADGGAKVCPAKFTINDDCQHQGQVCPYAGSQCGLKCTCSGGSWQCKTQWCECSCSCKKLLIASCELVACSKKALDPCPASASQHCAILCDEGDGGADGPDAGADSKPADAPREAPLPDLPPDKGQDLPADQGQDLPPDKGQDLPADKGQDLPADQGQDLPPDKGQDLPPDQAADAPQDQGPDAPCDMSPETSLFCG